MVESTSNPEPTTDSSAATRSHIDEDEAALYDRQIRLWGLEAQNRLRSASVLLINFRGLATEVAKNIVLAGINRLVILDDAECTADDLGANFFLREEDIGKKRAEAGILRLKTLNPRVTIESSTSSQNYNNPEFISQFDLICLTDAKIGMITSIGKIARKFNKRFHAAGSFGMDGYIFSDQGVHDYVIEKEELVNKPSQQSSTNNTISQAAQQKVSKKEQKSFISFDHLIANTHLLTFALNKRLRKKLSLAVYAIFILWEYQKQNDNSLPDYNTDKDLDKLLDIAISTVPHLTPGVELADTSLNVERLEAFARTADTEFTPSCAVVGGVLAQDILNVLGGREIPLTNFFVFDGSGDIFAVAM